MMIEILSSCLPEKVLGVLAFHIDWFSLQFQCCCLIDFIVISANSWVNHRNGVVLCLRLKKVILVAGGGRTVTLP